MPKPLRGRHLAPNLGDKVLKMNADQGAHTVWWLLAALLPLSALLSRRISVRGTVAMLLCWALIFATVLALFSYRQQFIAFALHVKKSVLGEPEQRAEGGALHIRASDDGHFWVMAQINGKPARFLVDSGATLTTLSADVAAETGLEADKFAPGMAMQTANGVVIAKRSTIQGLAVGPIITSNLPIVVSDRMNGVNVLGMNFLSRLKSWRVENGEMVLQP